MGVGAASQTWVSWGEWSRRLPDKYTAIMRVCVVILLSVMSAGPVVVSECQCMTVVFIEVDFDPTTHNFV